MEITDTKVRDATHCRTTRTATTVTKLSQSNCIVISNCIRNSYRLRESHLLSKLFDIRVNPCTSNPNSTSLRIFDIRTNCSERQILNLWTISFRINWILSFYSRVVLVYYLKTTSRVNLYPLNGRSIATNLD